MRGLGKGVMSATTQVKVSSPEIIIFAQVQRFHFLEASTVIGVQHFMSSGYKTLAFVFSCNSSLI